MIFRINELTREGSSEGRVRAELFRKNKKGTLFRLKRGLYSDDPSESVLAVANTLRIPSYVSFEFALSYHGLIPEGVFEITSATLSSRGRLTFKNYFGRFSYRNIPKKAFPYALIRVNDGLMASGEKALCDLLHTIHSVRSIKDLEALLFEDLRIDEEAFKALDHAVLEELCSLYPGDTFRLLRSYLERNHE